MRLDLSELRDVIGHVTIRFPIGHFLLAVLWNWNQATIYNGFRDIQRRMWHNGWYYLKRPCNGQSRSFWYQSISHIPLPRPI